MNARQARQDYRDSPDDVGTLWTMRRLGCVARCALMAWPAEWELRVLVDGEILLAEHRPRGTEAFALADEWRRRMLEQGWLQIVPASDQRRSDAQSEVISFRSR
jgi:hypothetical protein